MATHVQTEIAAYRATPSLEAELRALYSPRAHAPLWVDAAGRLGPDAAPALTLLRTSHEDGLEPADYGAASLDQMARDWGPAPGTSRDLARFDVQLSAAMLRYLRHLHGGRLDPRRIGLRLVVPTDGHDFPAILASAVAAHRVTEAAADLRPAAPYGALRTLLARYRALAADDAVPPWPMLDRVVRPGDAFAAAPALHRQLAALGDVAAESSPPGLYEGPLVEGVRRFQARHGLDPDGVVGIETDEALRVPIAWRVRQIELALERLRWLPHSIADRSIVINIPMFRLWAYEAGAPAGLPTFSTAVIVGRALDTETPVFVEGMQEVVFKPFWNVPRSILRNELLPAIESDVTYLERHDMEIVDGGRVVEPTADRLIELAAGRLRLRQRPGPQNALGAVKFVFPNEENVHIHGTPAVDLFSRSRRDFSHGCIRVEDPATLAEWVLASRSEWPKDRILRAMTDGAPTVSVRLARPIRVILFYTTAAIGPEDGALHFAQDIYGHDERLDRALRGRSS